MTETVLRSDASACLALVTTLFVVGAVSGSLPDAARGRIAPSMSVSTINRIISYLMDAPTTNLRHGRRKRASPEMMMFKFHVSINGQRKRLLPAATWLDGIMASSLESSPEVS